MKRLMRIRMTMMTRRRMHLIKFLLLLMLSFGGDNAAHKGSTSILQGVDATSSSSSPSSSSFKIRLPGSSNYEIDWDYEENEHSKDSSAASRRRIIVGSGREFNIFDSRGGGGGGSTGGGGTSGSFPYLNTNNNNSNNGDTNDDDDDDDDFLERRYRQQQQRRRNNQNKNPLFSSSSSPFPGIQQHRRQQQQQHPFGNHQGRQGSSKTPKFIQNIQQWYVSTITPRIQDLPKIVCRMEPTTTLKLRKTFRPLKTIIRVGADYNTQLGVWQFKSSWEDAIIGGKLTLKGKELQLTKSWQLSVGQLEDLVTRLRFRAAINLQTFQAYARVGFRTERLSPINVMEGFSISRRIPLDGNVGKGIKMEVKANIALPEPEIEYSTEKQSRTLIGMGNIEVSIDEMNLVLDY